MEGFAYRLIPVKQASTGNQIGGVNTNVMYDNLMNKFEFDIDKPGFLISEDVFRMTVTMRSTFSRLVDALVEENRMDSVVQVCDRIQELIPDHIVPYNFFNLSFADGYMKSGEKEKGTEILERMLEIQKEQLTYFFSFPENKLANLSGDIQQTLAVLHATGQIAEQNGLPDISNEVNELIENYYGLFLEIS
jgi:hypothetical protein